MKIFFFLAFIILVCYSCNTNYLPGFDFKLFKNSPVWELSKAVEKEDTSQIERILQNKSIKVDFHEPRFGNTLLMLAVVNNKKKSVKKLLEFGANPNEKDHFDNATPLLYACENFPEDCDSTIIKLLINYQGDVNSIQIIDKIENTGAHSIVKNTALMIATKNNCLEIVKTLLNYGANINQYTYYEGYSAVTEALIQENLEIAKYLIIDKQAKISPYCYIRDKGGKNEEKLTITDLLNEQQYDSGSKNYKYKQEIINYLKDRHLK